MDKDKIQGGNIFNGRYLMELQKIEKPGNQQKSRVNKSTSQRKRGVRCNTELLL